VVGTTATWPRIIAGSPCVLGRLKAPLSRCDDGVKGVVGDTHSLWASTSSHTHTPPHSVTAHTHMSPVQVQVVGRVCTFSVSPLENDNSSAAVALKSWSAEEGMHAGHLVSDCGGRGAE